MSDIQFEPTGTKNVLRPGYIAGDSDGQSYANIIGNVFVSGPSTSAHPCKTAASVLKHPVKHASRTVTRGNANFHAYVSDNYYDPDQVCRLDFPDLVLTLPFPRTALSTDGFSPNRQITTPTSTSKRHPTLIPQ